MRFLPALLAKIYPPVPLKPERPMDEKIERGLDDPIAYALGEAVAEHGQATARLADTHRRRVASTIEDLLARLGKIDAPSC